MKHLMAILLTICFSISALAWPKCKPDLGDPHHCHPAPQIQAPEPSLSEDRKNFYGVYAGISSSILFGALRDHKWGVLKSYLIAVGSSVLLVRQFEKKDLRREVDRATLPGAVLGPMLFFTF